MSANPVLNFEAAARALATGNLTELEARLAAARKRLENHADADPGIQCAICQDRGVISYDVPFGDALFGKLHPCPADVCPTRDKHQSERQALLLEKSGIADSRMTHWTLETWDAEVRSQNCVAGKREARWVAELFVFEVEPTTRERVDWNRTHEVDLVAANHYAGRDIGGGSKVRNSVVLQGDFGLGKTGLSIAIAQALIEAGDVPLWIRWQDFLDELKDSFGRKQSWHDAHDETTEDRLRAVERAKVLIVDDLNLEIVGNWRKETTERIFRYRSRKALPTIVTCNSTREELEKEWGRRAMEPLFEMAHYVRMGGPVMRDTTQVPEALEPF
jgi:DNA replication protein DnaC